MSNKTNRFNVRQLSCFLLVPLLLAGGAIQAADSSRITANTDIKPVVTLSADESRAVSLAAGRILLHTDRARQAIANKDKKTALAEINKGLTLVKVIEQALPKYEVTTEIKSGDVVYNTKEEVSDSYVPVFDEQYIEDVVAPVVRAKRKSHAASRMKQWKHTGKKAKKTSPPMAEAFSMWRRSSMKLNVALAADALALAKEELDSDKTDAADAALAVLQSEGVIFEFDEVELPLLEAADNLKLAELQIGEGNVAAARATLKVASDDLKRYEQITGESRAKDVRELHHKIDKLIDAMEDREHSGELKKAGQEIESYWRHVVKWFK